ncbi:MAG: insulinase family protein [Bacteroidetes bacterium]|nr:MAG: insulinase family protein [Bacteroidota bacterium]
MQDYQLHEWPNGLRLVYKQVPTTRIVHCGLVLDIGNRDETESQQGIVHFWEHMAFRGTKKRKAYHILNGLESVGGELNAYTSKEKICFYASVLDRYYQKAVELLSDITFHATFPQKQIEKERMVILEEMAMYEDAPDDAIQDDFDHLVFKDHPLGQNILGNRQSVSNYQQQDFQEFIAANLQTNRVVFTCVGNLPFNKVVKVADRYLGHINANGRSPHRSGFNGYFPQVKQINRAVTQAHCALGRTAYPITHQDRLPFFALINLLGGPGMNSRLNLTLREKHGLVYAIDAQYIPYQDTGMMAIFFGTDPKMVKRSLKLVRKELSMLSDKPLGTLQLHRAKEQLVGQLAMAEENNMNLMLMMGKSLLDLDHIQSLEDTIQQVRNITARKLQDLAQEMFDYKDFSILTFMPK